MNHVAVIISPNYKDYAKKYLADCLVSLRAQTFKAFDLFLVDNESSLETCLFMQSLAPEATVIPLETNQGFAGGNNAALKLVIEKKYDYVILVNMDTVLQENALEELIKVADNEPQAAAVQARLMLWPETELINSLGNETHFLGFGYCRSYRQPFAKTKDNNVKEITYASGAGVLYRVAILEKYGCYDEEFWMYNEDQDICLKFWLAGFKTIIAPRSVLYHKYEFSRSITKYYWLDRNRILVMLKYYRLVTLILLLPAFVIMELGTFIFSLTSGWSKEKIKVWKYFLSAKSWHYIMVQRKTIQRQRKISDRSFTKLFSARIWYQEINDWRLKIINPIMQIYWWLVRLVMFW
jgi:GT2 family glycosyltransferase